MKRNFIVLIVLLACANLQAYSVTFCQNTKISSAPGKLEKYVYKRYTSEKGKEKELSIGLTRPVDDFPLKKRPLIIGVHGGGFVNFCPFEPCYLKYSERILTPNFTPRGYATATVQYRLTAPFDFKPPKISDQVLKETHYKAAQDVRAAIKYIFDNADALGVDTENVFLIGTSAGAITVLHAAFLDDEEVPKDLLKEYGVLAKREKIRGVISLSGALYDLSYLSGGDKVPVMVVHGREDGIVPFEKGFYLGQKHLTPVYGGKAVFDEAEKQGFRAKGFFYDFGHDYPSRYINDIFKNANDFVRSNLDCAGENLDGGDSGH
ncbi:MAG: esterase/lipase-like protein [Acidobacteria bacterium]|jgi:predicted esterase|nr:esterase/lipase-like protein [Acidobacteriota bacterium]